MKMERCPTKEVIADLLTKPLQGELFRKLRDMSLGYSDTSVGEARQGVRRLLLYEVGKSCG